MTTLVCSDDASSYNWPVAIEKKQREGLFRDFLSGLRYPQLFLILLGLFAVDLLTPDPIFLVDEAIFGVLAVLLGMWRNRGRDSADIDNVAPDPDADLR